MGLVERIKRHRGKPLGDGLAEAEAARARAGAARQEASERRSEVAAVVGRLRAHRERNHFAEMIEKALRGGT